MPMMPLQTIIITTLCLIIIFVAKAERVVIHQIEKAQREHRATIVGSPFLSATLLASISPVHDSSIDENQKANFTTALTRFLKHVFEGQSVYDVEIISATIFDEQFVSNSNRKTQRRHLLTNQLQTGQFDFLHDEEDDDSGHDDWKGDGNGEEDKEVFSVMGAILGEGVEGKDDADGGGGWVWPPGSDTEVNESKEAYTLKVTTVISAEHAADDQSISHAEFQDMLLHICTKFQDHLVNYVSDSDTYFSDVENVTVSALLLNTYGESGTLFGSTKYVVNSLSAASIVGIVAAGIVIVLFLVGSIKLFKKERQLKQIQWRKQEIASANEAGSSIKSLRVLYNRSQTADDDYSFDPFGTEVPTTFYNGSSENDSNDLLRLRKTNGTEREETVSFASQPTETNSSLFSAYSAQYIYAPPGKVGVAIDVINGQPTVHKIRNGSPLEGQLQHGDIILAIDDVETSSMSAAEITQLMVRRMNYRRKISFMRPCNSII